MEGRFRVYASVFGGQQTSAVVHEVINRAYYFFLLMYLRRHCYSLIVLLQRLDLDKRLGELNVIHVAGTKGKVSYRQQSRVSHRLTCGITIYVPFEKHSGDIHAGIHMCYGG